jgi:hypothetical protein
MIDYGLLFEPCTFLCQSLGVIDRYWLDSCPMLKTVGSSVGFRALNPDSHVRRFFVLTPLPLKFFFSYTILADC